MPSRSRTALVTGANRGLGREVVRLLEDAGYDVMATSRDGSTGTRLDVTAPATIDALAGALADSDRRLDLVVNNAAIYGADDEPRNVIGVNVLGTLAVTDALVPHIRDGGHVLMVSSGMGVLSGAAPQLAAALTDPTLTRAALLERVERMLVAREHDVDDEGWPPLAYSVSKLALNALVRVLARELAPRRIRVNAVCPGWCRTTMGGPGAPRSAEEGAAAIVATALDATANAGFFRDGRAIPW